MNDQRFGPEHRLRHRPLFLQVYGTGRRAAGRYAVIFALARPEGGPWRLGLTATRRSGKSTARNRMRRRVREFFRRRGDQIPEGWDFVVNLKGEAAQAEFFALERDLARSLGRLGITVAARLDEGGAEPPEAEAER